ncbi:MAG: hypothetical protein M3P39_09615 [Actinomycetota bacterium]|nr:hypothetical protein [Actinomycetota bacterium]
MRREQGRLHALHRGVYAVGHRRVALRGRWWAAVLATGGAISHRTAADVHDLPPAPAGPIDILTAGRGRSTAALRVHRSATLRPERDVVALDPQGLRVTTPSRTLVDLAGVLTATA